MIGALDTVGMHKEGGVWYLSWIIEVCGRLWVTTKRDRLTLHPRDSRVVRDSAHSLAAFSRALSTDVYAHVPHERTNEQHGYLAIARRLG